MGYIKRIIRLRTIIFFIICTVSLQSQDLYPEKYYNAMEWRPIGPFRGGRSCAITGHPAQPEMFIMGTTGGGVWKTKNSGLTWENISDGYFGGSIGAVEIAEADPNIIYVGEGEQTIRGNVSPGRGMWKSDDAGKTWKKLGFENSAHIVRIRTHPKNPDIVLAAVLGNVFKSSSERGIYKSSDGGKSWKNVLFVNDSTGAADLVIDPVNPRILYATTWNMRRNAYQMISGGPGSALWKSIDGGDHWTNISKANGLPDGEWGISMVAVAPSDNDFVYAMIENKNGGLFRSDDGGLNWNLVNSDRQIRQRAWYFSRITVSPMNKYEIFALNVSLHKSVDGGKSFKTIHTHHADHHDLWFNPKQAEIIAVAHDGGGQISTDACKNWSPISNQPTAQFYRVTTDNHKLFRIYVAQQDNSTIRIAHRTSSYAIREKDWEPTAGGESGHIAIDPLNPDIVYGGSYGGYLNRYDHEKNISRAIHVWPDNPIGHGAKNLKYRFQWNFPLFFSPHNPKRLYTASNFLHLTENEGQSWKTISPDLSRNDSTKLESSGGPITKDNTSVEYYCTIFSAAESPLVKNLLWVGSDDGLVHMSRNGGESWINCTPKELPEWAMINSIEPSSFDPGTCYIAATLYKNGDFRPLLYKTEDYGKSWKKIVNGIEANHFTRVLRADPVRKGLLYCGTEYGMYISFDDGKNWKTFQLNLPIVPITDLCLKDEFLIASTQGRSIWLIDDLGPVRQIQSSLVQKKNFVYQPKPMLRMDGGRSDNKNTGTNHDHGLMLYLYLDTISKKDSIHMVCVDQSADTIASWSTYKNNHSTLIELKSGSNKLVLNPKMEAAKSFDGMVMWGASMSGPKALPGKYTLHISSKSYKDSIKFEIRPDPLYPDNEEDISKQFYFIKAIRDRINEAHIAIAEMRDLRNQLSGFCTRLSKNTEQDSLLNIYHFIDSCFIQIENELYQSQSKSNQDPINYPIKLTNKLAHLSALYVGGSLAPTDQAEELRRELDQLIKQQLDKYHQITESELKRFNELARQQNIDFIKAKKID